jgi:hypothetical protein
LTVSKDQRAVQLGEMVDASAPALDKVYALACFMSGKDLRQIEDRGYGHQSGDRPDYQEIPRCQTGGPFFEPRYLAFKTCRRKAVSYLVPVSHSRTLPAEYLREDEAQPAQVVISTLASLVVRNRRHANPPVATYSCPSPRVSLYHKDVERRRCACQAHSGYSDSLGNA